MISALFMHEHVYNEFVLDTVTKSGTDWVRHDADQALLLLRA